MEDYTRNITGRKPVPMPPVPVAAGMRTRRLAPRLVAITVVLISLFVFVFGTQALARRDIEAGSREQFIPLGTSHWAIVAPSEGTQRCIGITTLTLSRTPELTLHTDSVAALTLFGRPLNVKLEARATFGLIHELTSFSGEASVGSSRMVFRMPASEEAPLELHITTPVAEKRLAFPRPLPILLVERGPGRYTFRFPRLRPEREPPPQPLFLPPVALGTFPGVRALPVESGEAEQCRSAVQNPAVESDPGGLDIGVILKLLGVAPNGKVGELSMEYHDPAH